ncbi:hypothetical protein [Streptomyces eurythermus]|uniref:hypothetical protein n=1 Tax=Streptomyces eurythermus TaxID=42237 RepID=UPI0036FCB8C4
MDIIGKPYAHERFAAVAAARGALAVDPEDVPPGQTFIGNDVSSLPVFLRHK